MSIENTIQKTPLRINLSGVLVGNEIISRLFNRPKRLEDLDSLGFRNQIAVLYYLRVIICKSYFLPVLVG